MPVNHMPIDGLWRCLCPSFDKIISSQASRQSARLSTSLQSRRRKGLQARSFASTNTCHNDGDDSTHPSFRLSRGPAGRDLNVLKFTPQEHISEPFHTSREPPKPLFPGIAERRSTAQEDEREKRVVRDLFGTDLPDGVGRTKAGYRLGDWGNVPKGVGSVNLGLGAVHGTVPSPNLGASRAKKQKRKEQEELRQNEQKLVDLGPAKWGSMSFGRQTASAITPSHEENRQTVGAGTSGSGEAGSSERVNPRNGALETEPGTRKTTARIAAAYEKYLQKTAKNRVQRSGDAFHAATMTERLRTWEGEDVPMLHDRLRAYRLEAGQYDQVVALVEYLLVNRGDQLALLHYDSLIRANADAEKGSAECVRVLLEEMDEAGIKGDSGFNHAVLQTLAVHPDYALRAEIMQEMKERWFGLSPEGWHSLVIGLLRDRQLEMALDRLEEMHTDQILVQPWLYDIMTYVLCEHEEHDEAFNIMMYRYEHARFGISLSHWQYLLDTFSNASHYAATKHIWDARVRAAGDLIPSDCTCSAVLNIAARNSDPVLATSVISVLSARHTPLTIHHYEALLESYTATSDLNTTFRVLSIMEKAGLATTAASTRPIFTHLSSSHEECIRAWATLRELREEGYIIPISAVNVILESFNAQEKVEEAYTHYQNLHELTPSPPNLETINTMLQGLQRTPSSPSSISTLSKTPKRKAMSLAQTLLAHKITPNALTYDRLIRICLLSSSPEDVKDAFLYLKEMEEVGKHAKGEKWWMRSGTAMRMVEVCVQRGESERARMVLEECVRRGVVVKGGMWEMVERFEKREEEM